MIAKVLDRLAWVERALACVLLTGLLCAVLAQVVSRYVFHSPLPWTDEIARFLLVWLTFVAAGYVMAGRLHVTVDIAIARLGVRATAIVDTLATIVVVGASVVLAIAGVEIAKATANVASPATGLPVSVVYSAGTVGFALIALHGIGTVISNLKDPSSVPGGMENLEQEGL